MKMKQNVQTNSILLFAGIFVFLIGAFFVLFWPAIFKLFLAKEVVLSESSKFFKEWKSPSVELYFDVYLFNWTNAAEFQYPDFEKPKFQQLGPYRFREIRDKEDINFNNNSTVSYKPLSIYTFDEFGSNGTLEDLVTNVNIVAIGAAGHSKHLEYTKRKLVSWALNQYEQTVSVTKTARELLFEGYEDNMVLMGREKLIEGFEMNDNPYDRIGWLYLRNASTQISGSYNVHTGKDDVTKLGTIQSFNGLKYNPFYEGECSKLKGFVGELFPPSEKQDFIELFMPDMCRTIAFDYDKEVLVEGVTGYRYSAGKRAIDNGTDFPENLCYNSAPDNENFLSGVMNIAACRYSSPIFMSYPHFFDADRSYLENIDGLESNKHKHQSYITLEPMTGAPLEVVMRFQANFLLKDVENIALYQFIPTTFIPGMWIEQKFAANETMISQIKFALKIPIIGQFIGGIILTIGTVLILVSITIRCISKRRPSIDNVADVKFSDIKGSGKGQIPNSSPLLSQGDRKITIQKMDCVE